MEGKRILIAEDETESLDILVKKLRENNYEVMGFSGGRELLEKSSIFSPDLIILDIVMPDLDGYSVASAIRKNKNLKNTPIIFMSAKELEYSGIRKRMSDLGCCDFIGKPCTFDDLLGKIKEKIE